MLHYPSLDPLIYATFARVMGQVEGGDLVVVQQQRSTHNTGDVKEKSGARRSSELQGYRGGVLGGGGNGWTDGPWWRDEHVKRDLGVVQGLKEGSRLARVSAESCAREFFEQRGGVEAAAQRMTESLEEANPMTARCSDIFLAVQAVAYQEDEGLFAAESHAGQQAEGEETAGVVEPSQDSTDEDGALVTFALHLHDPLHSLAFSTLSQPFPRRWAAWLDASTSSSEQDNSLPESVIQIIESGGVDPREWIAEWIEEILSLGVGVVAQRYVARRMGVGEGLAGGMGRGKRRAEEEGVGGEAARAI